MSWGQIKFGDFITLQRGHDLTKEQFIPGEYPVVSSTTIMGYHNEYKAKAPGVVIGRSGTLGEVQYIDTNFWPHNTSLYVKDFKGNNPRFVYYFLKYFGTESSGGGSAVPTLNRNNLNVLDVNIPDVYLQKKISDILFVYDDLIENKQKQIKLLEEAAQRLYKEWFVDLRFPGYENTPITDGVPQGWKKELVGNVIEKSYRSKQVMTADYLAEGKIPIIDQSRDFIAGYTDDEETLVSLDKPIIVFGDHTRILKYIQFPFAKGADGTQLIVSKCENMPQALLYLSLLNVDLSNYHYARHFKYLKAEEIIVPDIVIAKHFEELVQPIFEKVQVLRYQINNAKQARDRLLPKLMSGKLEV
jgi:type I restriction enzyme S subunit